jgi:hypothetical protein
MFLSKLGYSELVQRLFEKMTFFLVDPLLNFILQALQNSGTALELSMAYLSGQRSPVSPKLSLWVLTKKNSYAVASTSLV